MTGRTVLLFPGARLLFEGQVVVVAELDGSRVTVRGESDGRYTAVALGELVARARTGITAGDDGAGELAPALSALTPAERDRAAQRAGHVREVITGYRSGHRGAAAAGGPRPEYRAGQPMKARYRAKAAELGVTARTVENWVAAYREGGEAALAGAQGPRAGGRVDPRWDDAIRGVLAGLVSASTPTRSAVVARAEAALAAEHGTGVVPVPSRATAYRRLAELTKGTNAVTGSASGRRSIASRPAAPYGRLRAVRPGEYVILDTQDLDAFAMEPVTCRWLPAQLTVALDLYTRSVLGLRLAPVSTKAVDVAGVLYEAVTGPPGGACHGVPGQLVLTETQQAAERPACAPETIVIDHGKAYLSAHVISVCTRLGISVQPAQPRKPTDKPTVERFFRTLREGLIQHLPAYKGPDVHSRGLQVEDAAFYYLHELEDIIRDWVTTVYHQTPHDGLVVPEWPAVALSPAQMLQAGIARAGLLRIPACRELAYDFLPERYRTIQHYGIEVDGLRYDGPVLNGYRNATSPYGGPHPGKWPVRVNPDDVRWVFFCDPGDGSWHRLEWEHAPLLGTPFSGEAARYARRLAAVPGQRPDPAGALAGLLERWDQGLVTTRRERRMASRLAAERPALSGWDDLTAIAAPLPAAEDAAGRPALRVVSDPCDELDEDDNARAGGADADFYADAFEVIE